MVGTFPLGVGDLNTDVFPAVRLILSFVESETSDWFIDRVDGRGGNKFVCHLKC